MSFWKSSMDYLKVDTPTYVHRPLANITFRQNSTVISLNLQDDITPKESAEISVMFAVAVGTAMTMALWDYIGYIKEHGLERHFEFKETE